MAISTINAASLGTSQLADANMAPGSVLQVVNATSNSSVSTNVGDATLTAVTASITPSSTSSKILVLARMPLKVNRGGSIAGTTAGWAVVRILRNGSAIQPNPQQTYENGMNFGDSNWNDFRQVTFIQSLDSPSSTSSITYTIQAINYSGAQTLYINEDGYYYSTITLMEIAG